MNARILIVLAVCSFAATANAYVQTRTVSGTAVHWEQSCIVVQPDLRGDTSGDNITLNDINTTLTAGTVNWNSMDGSCTFMRLGTLDAYQVLDAVADGTPAVVFRSDVWGRGDLSYDPAIIALTTVWFADRPHDPSDGLISDADIELNAVDYTFSVNVSVDVERDNTQIADLQNTLTHELGHVQGLAHTCWDHTEANGYHPVDNDGDLIPDCDLGDSLPDVIRDATMYPYADPGSISMRSLTPDDIAGICDNYPANGTATACYGYIQSKGCSLGERAATGTTRWPSLLVLLAPLFWLVQRRRARVQVKARS